MQTKMSSRKVKLASSHPDSIMESSKSATLPTNGADKYYAYKLREEKMTKLAAAGGYFTTADAEALGGVSDLEKLELKCLARLSLLGDQSPELLSYYSITSTSTREECAVKLAKKQYRKQLVEGALSKLLPSSEATTLIDASQTSTRTAIDQGNGFGL
jgi:hypothetical protein